MIIKQKMKSILNEDYETSVKNNGLSATLTF